MKKIYILISLFLTATIAGYSQTAFTAGNLVVYTVGNGSDTLSSAGFPVTLNEYTTSGVFIASHPLPTAISGVNKRIVSSGSATSEGQMTRSVDKRYLLVTGYDTFPDPKSANKIVSSTSASVNRVVGIVDATGNIDASTALTDAYSGNNIRSAASTDGNSIWTGGTGSASGVRYTTKGSTTSTQISSSVTNIRAVNIFNGQLYSSSSSGAFTGVCQDGTGLPTATGQTITLLPGFGAGSSSTYAFSVKPVTADVIYATSDNSLTSGGGIQKWTFDGTTWTLVYTLKSGLAAGTRGLVVDWSATNPILYAVTSDNPGNKIVKITDANDSNALFTTLDSSLAKFYIYRGIAFAPETVASGPTPVTLLAFKAALATTGVSLQWSTAQEINTKEFTIEKSTDGVHFNALSTVAASGNSSVVKKYQSVDKTPLAGVNYYRLKTTDIDGKISYSPVVKINFKKNILSIYPNPAVEQVTINHPVSINAVLLITDVLGRKIKYVNIASGTTSSQVSVTGLGKGQYVLKYMDNDNVITTILTKE